jgi:hypothetical protein
MEVTRILVRITPRLAGVKSQKGLRKRQPVGGERTLARAPKRHAREIGLDMHDWYSIDE